MDISNSEIFLKPNVVIEPLIDRWYAWSHLISPATAAMNIEGRHVVIMDSYIANPDIHAQAVQNPKMRGGPFMDFSSDRAKDVGFLRENTIKQYGDLLEFARSVKELDRLLCTQATGFGLESLYSKVPEPLKGYVELFYDRENNGGFRFFEPLLYKSKYWVKNLQSIALWVTNNDHRPFCLSTPRLDQPDMLHLNIPFDHVGIDELAKMKRSPKTFEYIQRVLHIDDSQLALFKTFFTSEPPPLYNKYTGDKIKMRYFGHACILIETADVSILVDPLISYYGYHSDVDRFSDVDLPDVVDYVLITHNHQDHILFETLLPLRHKIKKIVVPGTNSGKLEDPDLKLMFTSIGFTNVQSLVEMEELRIGDVTIRSIPFLGEHSDLNITTKCCYFVKIGEFKLLFLADSRILEPSLYEHVHKQIGDVDVLFLGMECDGAPLTWLYGPLMTKRIPRDQDGSRRLAGSDCSKGMSVIDIFHPKEVYVYAMGQEPWVEFISSVKYTDASNPIVQSNKLIELCKSRGITASRLFGEKELLYDRNVQSLAMHNSLH